MKTTPRASASLLCYLIRFAFGQECRETKRYFLVPLVFLTVIVLSAPIAALPNKEVRRILILNETNSTYPGIAIINQGIQRALNDSPYHLEFYAEYMDTSLFPDPVIQQEFRDSYIRKYQNRKLDVIITAGPSPLKFMQEVHQRAFPGVPIVFCLPTLGVPGTPTLDPDFTGVENDIAPAQTVGIALQLLPNTKNIVVVGGVAPIDREQLTNIKKELTAYEDRVEISYLTNLAMPDVLERLRHLPSNTIVLLTSVGRDATGLGFKSNELGPMVANAANAPVFSLYDVYLNHGEVGGYLSSLSEQGNVAGSMALRILKGGKPRDIPRAKGVNAYMFDWHAIRRWGLKESALPPGSIILNSQLTIWESYKWYIMGGVFLVLLETLLILGLAWQRARRKRAETELRESEERFRLVANTAPVMIWMSGPDKLCNYFNKPWLDFTGRPLEAELGNGWAEGVHPDDFSRCLQTYMGAFDRKESFELQYRLQRHDGEYRWVLDKGVPRFDPRGIFAGYIGSGIDITEQKLADEALATIGRRLIEAHEEERTWIARELHDDINQQVALLANELHQLHHQLPPAAIKFHDCVHHLSQRLLDISVDIQALSHRLHSSKLEYLGIVAAAETLCKELSEQQKVEIDFSHTSIPQSLPKEIALCLFRVLQETLRNAIKHSGVRHFKVELHGREEEIQLTVSDSGVGFDPKNAMQGRGLGLISMSERMQLVRGEISIKSYPGSGTTVQACVPFKGTDSFRAVG